jgi:hypothetical protein
MRRHPGRTVLLAARGQIVPSGFDRGAVYRLRRSAMKNEPSVKIGRLAMRHEGAFWNAYYALPNTMDGALPLGSIAMRFIGGNEERKTLFMNLMREAVSDLIEEQTGQRPTWPEGVQPAPHHERAGHG